MMKKIVLISLICFYALTAIAGEKITTIKLASEEWEKVTEKKGKGLYWDIFRMVYNPVGIDLKTKLVPYTRSMNLAKKKKVDAAVAAYVDEVENVLYSKLPFDSDITSVVFLKNKVKEWKGESSLVGKKVGWIRGYEFDEYLSVKIKKREINKRKQAFSMLEKGRIDFFMDAMVDLQLELAKGYMDAPKYQIKVIKRLNLYLVFAKNKRGEALKKIYDERMPQLVKSGKIKQLFDKWKITSYPYDKSGKLLVNQ